MSFNAPGPMSRKVAIPRLQRPSHSKPSTDRRRVSRACTACRAHKIKCTGDVPQCKHCETTGRECVYIMPRKDRLKSVTERCMQMAGLLKKLRGFADEEDSARIGELLEATDEDTFEASQNAPPMSNPDTNDEDSKSDYRFEAKTTEHAQRWETESLDLLDENLHENDQSRATGFVGQNSEVQWLRTFLLSEHSGDDMTAAKTSPFATLNHEQVSAVTYYLDNQSIELGYQVDPYSLPSNEVAQQLLSAYMEKVHDSFPILPRKLFEEQYRKYFEALKRKCAPRLNRKWQAILNLVFAIGAKYSHLSKPSWEAHPQDHLLYRARACALAWNESSLEQHPDLPQIQVAGLLAFYYLSVGQVSRAWIVVGMAIRFAVALGLHVRNEDRSASISKKEVLIRVWWSLCHLERQINITTGRPSAVFELDCSVPLPAPFSEQQIVDSNSVNNLRRSSLTPTASPTAYQHFMGPRSLSNSGLGDISSRLGVTEANSGSYFTATVQLSNITQSVLTSLYTAGTKTRSPDELQQAISQLGQRLDDWYASLPLDFAFQMHRPGWATSQSPFHRERTFLTFQFCSARILLTRPCLISLKGIWNQKTPADFIQRMASMCIETAKAVVDILPDQAHPLFLYEFGPWWTVVHNLTQSLAVFLLALSYSHATCQDNIALAAYCTKIIRWLRSMDDPLAERAYRLALNSFEVVAKRLSFPLSEELFFEPQLPISRMAPDIETQMVHPGALSTAPGMVYGYTEPAISPSIYSIYDQSAAAEMYISPPADRSFYQHQRDN